jgi:hypothetical protein
MGNINNTGNINIMNRLYTSMSVLDAKINLLETKLNQLDDRLNKLEQSEKFKFKFNEK